MLAIVFLIFMIWIAKIIVTIRRTIRPDMKLILVLFVMAVIILATTAQDLIVEIVQAAISLCLDSWLVDFVTVILVILILASNFATLARHLYQDVILVNQQRFVSLVFQDFFFSLMDFVNVLLVFWSLEFVQILQDVQV